MEIKNSKIRSSDKICKCCLRNRHVLKDLWCLNLVEGDRWVYGEMITNCFAIYWQKPVDRTELICESCRKCLLNAFKFKRDVLASEQILLKQLEGENNECIEIAEEEDMKDDDIIQEDLTPGEDSEDKAVTDNFEHFEQTVVEDIKDELKFFEAVYLEDSIIVEPVKQEIDPTNMPQQQENTNENENCTEKDLENCLKHIASNKLVPVVVLDRHIPKKSEQLKQRKTEATHVLKNQEVYKTDCSSDIKKTHEYKEEPKEITSEFISNIPEHISERTSAGIANKRDSTQQTQQYSAEDLQLCLDAVKSERLTAVAASVMYNVPISTIYIIMDKDKNMPNVTANTSVLKHLSRCALCGQDISSSSSPAQHKCTRAANTSSRDIEEQEEQTATKFTCDICKRDFKRKRTLYQHIVHIHKYADKSKLLFTCKICNKRSTSSSELSTHERIHTGDKPYSCKICSKRFSRNWGLTTHQRVHTGEKPYSCKICNKQFSISSSLHTHQRVHTGDKPYSCKICNKQFSISSSLYTHQRVHTGDKPYSCKICNKRFSTSSGLYMHQRVHTGDKPYSCKICNKRFSRNWDLITHQRVHTGEKPYSCKICNKRFSISSSLHTHQRVHTGDKRYSCKICNKRFKSSSELSRHERIHTGDKTYSCKVKR